MPNLFTCRCDFGEKVLSRLAKVCQINSSIDRFIFLYLLYKLCNNNSLLYTNHKIVD